MKTYIMLLRGINVGGRNTLPMKELVALIEELGCQNIKTYIQSGNVVLRCAPRAASALAGKVSLGIENRRGFRPHVLLWQLEKLEHAMAANPFPEAEADPSSLHLAFLDSAPPEPDLTKLQDLRVASERFRLIDRVFDLYAFDGIQGRSPCLAANTERLLGVPATDRNWRTVCKLRELAKELE